MRKYLILFLGVVMCGSLFSQNTLKIKRIDKQIFEYLENGDEKNISSLENTDFINALCQTLGIPTDSKSEMLKGIQTYYKHPALFGMYKDTENKFSDMSSIELELSESLNRASGIMSVTDKTVFGTHVSGLKENIISVNNIISLSLDKYLGSDYSLYRHFFTTDQLLDMSPDMIVRDYIKAWLIYNYVQESSNQNLLSQMIFEGKIIYILSQLLPEVSLEHLLGKNSSDIDNYRSSNKKVWKKILNSDLYSQDKNLIHKWMVEENQIGVWLGYEIVTKYMNNNNSNIDTLLKLSDQDILRGSKYNP